MSQKRTRRDATSSPTSASGPPSAAPWLWALLFLHLGVSPLLVSSATTDAFDYPKSLLLQAVAVMAATWMLLGARGDRMAHALRRSPGPWLFTVSAIVSTIASVSPHLSWAGANDSFSGLPTLLAYVVLFFATRAASLSHADRLRLVVAPVLASVPVALFALVQTAGLDVFSWQRVSSFGGVRAFSTLGHPNTLSAYLVCVLPIMLALSLRAHSQKLRPAFWALSLSTFIASLAVLASRSRSGWIGLALAVVCLGAGLAAGGDARGRKLLIAAPVLGVSAFVAVGAVMPSFAATLRERAAGLLDVGPRRFIWDAALQIFQEHPLTGAGVDTFGLMFGPLRTSAYWTVEWNAIVQRAHNEPLHIMATQGLLGLIALSVLVLGVLLDARRAWTRVTRDERALLTALLASLAAFSVMSLAGFTQPALGALVATWAGLVSRMADADEPLAATSGPMAFSLSMTLCTVAPLLLLGLREVWTGGLYPSLVTVGAWLTPALLLWTCRGAFDPSSAPGALRPTRPSGVVIATGFGAFISCVLLVSPLRANLALTHGLRLTSSSPIAAMDSFGIATDLAPRNAFYWSRLGLAAQAAATLDRSNVRLAARARDAFLRARTLEPRAAEYEILACRFESAMGTPDALAGCVRALEREPSHPYFHTAATHAAIVAARWSEARLYATRVLTLYPGFAAASYQLGFIDASEGKLDQAEAHLRAALAGDWHGQPGLEAARQTLAEVRRRRATASTLGPSPTR